MTDLKEIGKQAKAAARRLAACTTEEKNRALLAMAVFGIRSLASVPSFFLLAVPALRSAALRSPLPFGRGKRVASAGNDTGRWKGLCAVSAALLAALLLESALSSGLLRLVWEHFIAA